MKSNYQKQLAYIFDRDTTTEEAWYNLPEEGDVEIYSDREEFEFIEQLFLNCANDLKPFSNDQIGLGLNYIFNNACSNMVHSFRDAEVTFERRDTALRTLFILFRDVLNPRCEAISSHHSQAKLSQINYICYMFWDVTSLSYWKNHDTKHYKTIAEVMQNCLTLSSPSCVESGLHGLGHLAFSYPDIAVPIIDDFLKKNKKLDPKLADYAKAARTGMIQ